MANFDYELTALGKQLQAQALAAQAQPMMGIPGQGVPGGQYNFDHSLLQSTMQPQWQSGASAETGFAPNDMAGRWQRFTDANGNPMVAAPNYGTPTSDGRGQDAQITSGALNGWSVFPDPGDMGGGWLGAGHESQAMNGRKYDNYDAQGNYTGNGAFSNWQDDFLGPAGALAVLAMPFAAAAAGLGGAAGAAGAGAAEGAGAAAGAGAGAAGASDLASLASAYGGGGGGLSGWSLGGMGNELAAQGIINSGAGLAGDVAAGAAGGAVASGGGGQATAPAVFNPAVDSQLASSQLGITGSQAAADAAAAGIPSVTVNGAPTGSWLSNLTASGGAAPGTGDVGGGTLGSLTSGTSGAGSLIPGVSNSSLLGAATTALGGLAGSQSPAGGSGGAGGVLDSRMEPYLYGSGGLLPQTQATLNQQQPLAQQQAAQMASAGSGLLGQSVAGNGVGKVSMDSIGSFMDPYYEQRANDISRRTQDMLGQNNLAISGHSVGTGGLGGSRMGVEQGIAAGKAADYLQGNLATLGSNMYGQALNASLGKYNTDTNFYSTQRNSDLAGAQLGGSLLGQSQTQAFGPLTSASNIYKPYTGLASANDSGTDWSGVAGGLLSGAALAGKLGWWK